jgi:hypothetical protein
LDLVVDGALESASKELGYGLAEVVFIIIQASKVRRWISVFFVVSDWLKI